LEKSKRRSNKIAWGLSIVFMAGLVLSYISALISPQNIAILSFFGLLYPFWLGLNAVGLVGWLFFSIRKSLIILVVILAGWNQHNNFFSFSSGTEVSDDFDLSVISYNVRLFDLYNWTQGSQTRDSIFQFLEHHEADVICFQEFYHTDRKGVFETRDTLLTFLTNKYIHEKYTHKMVGDQYFGVVTFSRFPIVGKGEIPFSSDPNNFCIYSDIRVGEDTIRIYNAHLASIRFQQEDYDYVSISDDQGWFDGSMRISKRLLDAYENRAEQSATVRNNISDSPHPVVLCGDFNDTPVSFCYNHISKGLTDAFVECGKGVGNTYVGKFPSFRIDYMLNSAGLEPVSYRTLDVRYSDHLPLEARYKIE
jgi:endonuclease/exonuclease/phosphatase family metal-dependent hydrolase